MPLLPGSQRRLITRHGTCVARLRCITSRNQARLACRRLVQVVPRSSSKSEIDSRLHCWRIAHASIQDEALHWYWLGVQAASVADFRHIWRIRRATNPHKAASESSPGMLTMRRYVEPPRVRVLDFSTGSTQDRFGLPKASIVISTDGKRMLGMQERPSVKVLRYAADAAAAAASAAAQDRQMATPCGRRHSAYHRHLEVMRRQEQQQCVDAVLAGSIARSAAAARKALMSGSGGVRGCLEWHTERQEGEEEEEAAEEADVAAGGSRLVQLKRKFGQQSRPGTAPAAATAEVRGRLGPVGIWSQAACEATSPRFKARTAFEQRRAATPDSDAIRRHGYLQLHKQRRVTQAAREAREGELAATWPHGLPKAELRRALAAGLRVVGVGVGGNPLSLQRSTYLALRPGMKWY